MKVYKCNVCGNVVEMMVEGGGTLVCCDEEMELLTAKETDEGNEKHLPVITIEGNTVIVKVGSIEHPMVENHSIQFIQINYNNKKERILLKPGMKPEAVFNVQETGPIMIFEYCNLHGLWKTSVYKNN